MAALALTLVVPGSAFAAASTSAVQSQAVADEGNKPAAESKAAANTTPVNKAEPKSQPATQTSTATLQKTDGGAAKNESKPDNKPEPKGEPKQKAPAASGKPEPSQAKNDHATKATNEHKETAKSDAAEKGSQTRYPPTVDRPIEQSGADAGDNRHPSGKDRSVENGPEKADGSIQGKSPSAPDNDGRGPERDSTQHPGVDKPGYLGGDDRADQDNNNGCGNDDDFEDDNEGLCGGKSKRHAHEEPEQPVEETPDNRVDICRGASFMSDVKESDLQPGDRIVDSAAACKRAEKPVITTPPTPTPTPAAAPEVEVAGVQTEPEAEVPADEPTQHAAAAPLMLEVATAAPEAVADVPEVAGETVVGLPPAQVAEDEWVFAFVPIEEAVPLTALDLTVARAPVAPAEYPMLTLLPSTGGPAPIALVLVMVGLGSAGLWLRRIGRP